MKSSEKAPVRIALVCVDDYVTAFGVRHISSVLKTAGHETKLVLMSSKESVYPQQVLDSVRELVADFDVIGLSCFSRASKKAIQVLEYVRSLGRITVWGGIHATLNPEECVQHANVVCRGEGEEFMLELAARTQKKRGWRDIPNAVYRGSGRIVANDIGRPIPDLDMLPGMDFSRDDEWHLRGGRLVRVCGVSDDTAPIAFNGTRGCAGSCTYCSNAKLKQLISGKGKYVRKLSVERLVEHAEDLRRQFPKAKCLEFYDEDFCARSVADIERFARDYAARVGIPFGCMVSPRQVSEEKIAPLVEAGLWRIHMGVESGSERTKREVYNRPMSNDLVLRAARAINKHPHVVPFYFFIIGNPYETREDLLSSVHFLRDMPYPFYLRMYNLVFFPGTLLYEAAVRDGIIDGSRDSGCELNFLAGFNYRKHSWKRKNLYLNGLLYLMDGRVTRRRLGLVPRRLLGLLLRPGVVAFSEKHTLAIRGLITFKLCLWKLRCFISRGVKKLLKDPRVVYRVRKSTSADERAA
jgi:radical SAM superfamily enzyme YgiQ (UPF0313 family)